MSHIQQFDTSMELLEKVLDMRAKNQQIIGSNIANAETPGYSAKSFEFEDQLQAAMSSSKVPASTTHPAHIPLGTTSLELVQGSISVKKDETGIGDENSVSVDEEMIKLSENEILYETAITMLKKKLSMLKYTIAGGA